jgi:hypothetical protein
MACSGRFADADDYQLMWGEDYDPEQEPMVLDLLDKAATQIHAAMASAGACDCTLSGWAEKWLGYLNVLLAGCLAQSYCTTPDLEVEERRLYLEYVNAQLEMIANGEREVCEGETASQYPVGDWVEIGVTPFAVRNIYENYLKRTRNT